jgi:hypothetical protein
VIPDRRSGPGACQDTYTFSKPGQAQLSGQNEWERRGEEQEAAASKNLRAVREVAVGSARVPENARAGSHGDALDVSGDRIRDGEVHLGAQLLMFFGDNKSKGVAQAAAAAGHQRARIKQLGVCFCPNKVRAKSEASRCTMPKEAGLVPCFPVTREPRNAVESTSLLPVVGNGEDTLDTNEIRLVPRVLVEGS